MHVQEFKVPVCLSVRLLLDKRSHLSEDLNLRYHSFKQTCGNNLLALFILTFGSSGVS